MSWINEHETVRAVDAKIEDLRVASAKWHARQGQIQAEYEAELKTWADECERAAWEDRQAPPRPAVPESFADRQLRAGYWISKRDELLAERQRIIATLEPEWWSAALDREAKLLREARPLLERLAAVGQQLDGLLAEQREVVQAARGGLPQITTAYPRSDGQPVAERIQWHRTLGPQELLEAVMSGRVLVRIDEVRAANEAALQGRTMA